VASLRSKWRKKRLANHRSGRLKRGVIADRASTFASSGLADAGDDSG
jgi:hypothetical protein